MKNKIHILHVDDNPLDRQLVKDALCKEHNAFEIIEADSREKFEFHLDEQDFDLILSDFNILGFDGLQVLQIVHDKNPVIPVIIVTGTGSEEVAIQAMKMGASDYVIKSVKHIRGLAHTIEKVLENKKNRDERNRALTSLKKSEEKYRRLFENMQDVYYQIDEQDIIREISPSIFKLAGYKREELIGIAVTSFYYDIQEREDMLGILSQKGVVWDFEVRLIAKSGQVKYASLNAHFMLDENNKQIGIEGSLRDIDKRKHFEMEMLTAKEKAEESDRLKSAFLANMSHEIRTPMNGILGFTSLLLEPDLTSEQKEHYIEIVHKSGQRMLNTVTDIVEISKIEAGIVQIVLKETDINVSVEELVRFFKPEAEKKGLQLILNKLLPESAKKLITDQNKLDSILTNLIKNAIKYTDSGAIELGCRTKGTTIEFYIKDTGIGISVNRQKAVFERFTQADIADKRAFQGSGLGLSISKSYVEMLGGKIWVESEEGLGSTFYFTLPLNINESEITFVSKESKSENENNIVLPAKLGLKILIAEDDEPSLNYISLIVKDFCSELLEAVTGIETVELCRSTPDIDLILMDIQMPGMNGYEATLQIREFNRDVIIVAQTAFAIAGDKEKAIDAGCNDYITKPVKKVELQKLIERYFAG